MIRHIFIDLDETILDFHIAEKVALTKTLEALDIVPTKETCELYSRLNNEQWKKLELGEISLEQVKLGRYERLFSALGVERSAKEAVKLYEGNLSKGFWFKDGAEAFLKNISADYSLALVTNGTAAVQRSRIKCAGLEAYFDHIFISQEIGYFKPAIEFFDYCFGCIENFDKEKAVMIGDSLTSDIKGGNDAGIKTILYDPESKPVDGDIKPTYTVRSFIEAETIIRRL